MKKIVALVLLLMMVASAALAEGKKYTVGDFTITVPYSWTAEQDDSDDTPTYTFLGFYYSSDITGLNLEGGKNYLPDFEKVTLMGADFSMQEYYIQTLEEDFADDSGKYLKTVYNPEGIPFFLLSGTDELGPYYYADTVLDGWCYSFYFYAYTDENYDTARTLTEDDLAQATELLSSVRIDVF